MIRTVESINCAGIRDAARKAGITFVTELGSYEHPEHPGSNDWRIQLYQLGDVRVAATNGDPVFEEDDPAAFAELLESYGACSRPSSAGGAP